MKYIDIRVGALSEIELGEFLRLCQQIQYLGVAGSSRHIDVHVDGDGSGRLTFVILDKDPKKNEFLPLPKFDPNDKDARHKFTENMKASIGE